MWLATPPASESEDRGDARHRSRQERDRRAAKPDGPIPPGAWLEHSPLLNVAGRRDGRGLTSSRYFGRAAEPLNAITVNILNFTFLIVGVLLHRTPARLMHAVQAATPAVWGVILQFPFYAGIAAIITTTHLNERLANAFVSISIAGKFSGGGRDLFGGAGRVRAVGRIEVGDRSAVRDAGGARAEGASRLGGGVVRSRRGAREPAAAVLDAADAGDVRAASARRDGLHLHRLLGARARGDPAGHAARRDAAVSAARTPGLSWPSSSRPWPWRP